MRLFANDNAEMNKKRAGEPYRPANVTEVDLFFGAECRDCIHQTDYKQNHVCETESLSFWVPRDHARYPIELQYGPDGQPCCRRKNVIPSAPYENIDGEKFHFNAPVIFCLCPGKIDDRIGRLVQVRKKIGSFGGDIYFLRRNDGSLVTGENLYLKKYYGYVSPPHPGDSEETEYTVFSESKYPETGFIIDKPCGPPPMQQSFAITATEW